MVAEQASRLWWRRYLRRNAIPSTELAEFPSLSPEEQRRELARRLHAQIQYFGRRDDALPEWREAARIQDPKEVWRIWPSLPVVTKETLRDRFHPREMQPRFGLEGRADSSGGSTGEPVHFLHDPRMLRAIQAAGIFARTQMGWRPGMATVVIWGSERDIGKGLPRKVHIQNRLLRQFLVDGYAPTVETVKRVLRLIERHRPAAVYGFTSLLEYVAREALKLPPVPPGSVHVAWNGGEMLFPEQSELFRKAFGVGILNLYGGRELGAMAFQKKEGGPIYALRPWLFVEIVDDRGRPVAPGESGRLLCTSTVCRGTPFLRYDSGDLGVAGATCQNEAGVVALNELLGRVASVLELPDGRRMNNIFWNHLFKEFPEVHQFQVRLKKDGKVQIQLVGDGFVPPRKEECLTILRNFLESVPVEVVWVSRIPLTAQGKHIQVVRE
jgi:phenylacetate-CoA ligase